MSAEDKKLKSIIESDDIEQLKIFIKDTDESFFFNSKIDEKQFAIFHKIVFCDMTLLFYSAIQSFSTKFRNHKKLLDLLNIEDIDGNIALHYAAYRGNIDIIKELIKLGCNPYTKNYSGLSLMHLGAQGDSPNVLIFFKEKYQMDILERDINGSTPLHWACFMSSENAVNYLLSWMTDVNIIDNKGQSPLLIAIFSKRVSIIKKLLNKGANSSLKNASGLSVMEIAKSDPGNTNIFQLLTDYKPFKLCYYTSGAKRTFYNAYLFAVIALICQAMAYFVLIPYLHNYFVSIIFVVVTMALTISFSYMSTSDPGILVSKYHMDWLELTENKIDVNEICPYCKVNKNSLTKHCHTCGHCVQYFDHHCNWINNCIGDRNSNPFILFLAIIVLNLSVNFFIGFKAYCVPNTIDNLNTANDILWKQPFFFTIFFAKSIKDISALFLMAVNSFFFLPVSYVIFTQIRHKTERNKRIVKEREA